MFLNIFLFSGTLIRPGDRTIHVEDLIGTVAGALCANDEFRNVVLAAIDLPGHAVLVHPVGKLEVYAEKIILVARYAAKTASHPNGFYRMAFGEPVNYIKIMHVLLDDVVAGEPGPVDPISDHPFHVRPFWIALLVP